jgi:hypothetical protein
VVVLPVQGVPVMSMTRFMGYVGLGVSYWFWLLGFFRFYRFLGFVVAWWLLYRAIFCLYPLYI